MKVRGNNRRVWNIVGIVVYVLVCLYLNLEELEIFYLNAYGFFKFDRYFY